MEREPLPPVKERYTLRFADSIFYYPGNIYPILKSNRKKTRLPSLLSLDSLDLPGREVVKGSGLG